jgi:hypothetical protein
VRKNYYENIERQHAGKIALDANAQKKRKTIITGSIKCGKHELVQQLVIF